MQPIAEGIIAMGLVGLSLFGLSQVFEQNAERVFANMFADDITHIVTSVHEHQRDYPNDHIEGWGADGLLLDAHYQKLHSALADRMAVRIADGTVVDTPTSSSYVNRSPYGYPYQLFKDGETLVVETDIRGRTDITSALRSITGRDVQVTPTPSPDHDNTLMYRVAVRIPPTTKSTIQRLAQSSDLNVAAFDSATNDAEVSGVGTPIYSAEQRLTAPEAYASCADTDAGATTTINGEVLVCRDSNIVRTFATATSPTIYLRRWEPAFRAPAECLHGTCDTSDTDADPNLCTAQGVLSDPSGYGALHDPVIKTQAIDNACRFQNAFKFSHRASGDTIHCDQHNKPLPVDCVPPATILPCPCDANLAAHDPACPSLPCPQPPTPPPPPPACALTDSPSGLAANDPDCISCSIQGLSAFHHSSTSCVHPPCPCDPTLTVVDQACPSVCVNCTLQDVPVGNTNCVPCAYAGLGHLHYLSTNCVLPPPPCNYLDSPVGELASDANCQPCTLHGQTQYHHQSQFCVSPPDPPCPYEDSPPGEELNDPNCQACTLPDKERYHHQSLNCAGAEPELCDLTDAPAGMLKTSTDCKPCKNGPATVHRDSPTNCNPVPPNLCKDIYVDVTPSNLLRTDNDCKPCTNGPETHHQSSNECHRLCTLIDTPTNMLNTNPPCTPCPHGPSTHHEISPNCNPRPCSLVDAPTGIPDTNPPCTPCPHGPESHHKNSSNCNRVCSHIDSPTGELSTDPNCLPCTLPNKERYHHQSTECGVPPKLCSSRLTDAPAGMLDTDPNCVKCEHGPDTHHKNSKVCNKLCRLIDAPRNMLNTNPSCTPCPHGPSTHHEDSPHCNRVCSYIDAPTGMLDTDPLCTTCVNGPETHHKSSPDCNPNICDLTGAPSTLLANHANCQPCCVGTVNYDDSLWHKDPSCPTTCTPPQLCVDTYDFGTAHSANRTMLASDPACVACSYSDIGSPNWIKSKPMAALNPRCTACSYTETGGVTSSLWAEASACVECSHASTLPSTRGFLERASECANECPYLDADGSPRPGLRATDGACLECSEVDNQGNLCFPGVLEMSSTCQSCKGFCELFDSTHTEVPGLLSTDPRCTPCILLDDSDDPIHSNYLADADPPCTPCTQPNLSHYLDSAQAENKCKAPCVPTPKEQPATLMGGWPYCGEQDYDNSVNADYQRVRCGTCVTTEGCYTKANPRADKHVAPDGAVWECPKGWNFDSTNLANPTCKTMTKC